MFFPERKNQRTFVRSRERGFALLIVLWTLGLLALLGTRVVSSGHTEAKLAANLERAARLQATADGAVRTAMFHRLPGAPPWPADGLWHPEPDAAPGIALRIAPLSGRINPNLATPEEWLGLLSALGLEQARARQLAGALIAWRTPGVGDPSLPLYARDNRAWGPPGSPFETLGELGLVYGMTPDVLALLRPHLSLAQPLEPDPGTADPVVQRALALAGGGAPIAAGQGGGAQAYLIEATARDDGTRAGRSAVVLLDPADADRPARILQWDPFPAPAP